MKLGGACLIMTLWLSQGAQAQPRDLPPALDAESFDALTRGKTFDTHDEEAGLYGIESFFENRRVIWKDRAKCVEGIWYPAGAQICFIYDGQQHKPVCWRYHQEKGAISGLLNGDPEDVPIWLFEAARPPLECNGFVGA